jgi:hypothetical protein
MMDECPFANGAYLMITVQVINSTGAVVYPPAVPGTQPDACRPPRVRRVLKPGQQVKRSLLVVLRGTKLQALATLFIKRKHYNEEPGVMTRPGTVQLSPAPVPSATIVPAFTGASVAVTRPPGAVGALWYQYREVCQEANGDISLPHTDVWAIANEEDRFLPAFSDCPQPREWHAVAGWLNYPVATVDYTYP